MGSATSKVKFLSNPSAQQQRTRPGYFGKPGRGKCLGRVASEPVIHLPGIG